MPTSTSTPASPARDEALAAGIDIGTPVVYRPQAMALAGDRIAGTSVDDRAGCAVMRRGGAGAAGKQRKRPTMHLVFSVQEEFNLRGAVTAAQALQPDIAIQLDLLLATDTPDMGCARRCAAGRRAGDEPVLLPRARHAERHHPASGAGRAVRRRRPRRGSMPLQRSAHTGALTDSSYVQLVGGGVASIDLGFPCATRIPRSRSAISPISTG